MPEDAPHYEYKFEDNSILLRLLERGVLAPIVAAIPRGITPNQITIAGQLAAGAGFALVLAVQPMTAAALILLSAAILFSTLADCVDGLFARHSKQTSRLGELLDHWLDALSVPLIVLSFGLALAAAPSCCFAAVVAISFLHFATFLHGFRLGHVTLGKIGMIEGAGIGAMLCMTAVFFGIEPLSRPLLAGLSFNSMLLLVMVAGSCSSLLSMRGLLRHGKDFTNLALLLAALVLWYAFGRVSAALAGVCVIAVGSYLEGHVIRARLLRVPVFLKDSGLLVLALGGAAASLTLNLDARAQSLAMGLVIGYVLLRESRAFLQTVSALRAPPRAALPGARA